MSGFGMEPEPESEETGFHEAVDEERAMSEEPRIWIEFAVDRMGNAEKWYDEDGNFQLFQDVPEAIERVLTLQRGVQHQYHDTAWVMRDGFLGAKTLHEIPFDVFAGERPVSCPECRKLMEDR